MDISVRLIAPAIKGLKEAMPPPSHEQSDLGPIPARGLHDVGLKSYCAFDAGADTDDPKGR